MLDFSQLLFSKFFVKSKQKFIPFSISITPYSSDKFASGQIVKEDETASESQLPHLPHGFSTLLAGSSTHFIGMEFKNDC